MLASAGRSSWLTSIVCFTLALTLPNTSEAYCQQFRTGTLGKYLYPMKELAMDLTSFNFSVKVMKYAYIMLSPFARDTNNQYEIAIGNSEKANTAAIRRCRQCEDRESVTTPYTLLEFNEFKQFWISYKSGRIQIGRGNESAFMSWTDLYPLDVRFIGIATGLRLPGDFIFCDLKFNKSQDVSFEGLFGLCVLFLPAIFLIIRAYLKDLKKRAKPSSNSSDEDETDSFDDFYTIGIENPTEPQPDRDPPSYEKCMEDDSGRLPSIEEGASTSMDDSEPPPSYESAMAYFLYDMNCDAQTGCNQTKGNIISMWDSKSMNENTDNFETFV